MVEVKAKCEMAKTIIKNRGYEPVSPLEIQPSLSATYSTLMGNCIAALLTCDAVVFLNNNSWFDSKGCRLEKDCAEIYDIKIYIGVDALPKLVPPQAGMAKEG